MNAMNVENCKILTLSTIKQYKFHIYFNRFPTKTILTIHLKGVHEGAYVHVCEICAKVFKSKMFFLKHMEDVHTNTTRAKIQCQKCGKWLKHEESLRKHMTRHTDSEKGQHVCNICGKPSPNRSALQSHKKYSHMIERSHKCGVCSKAFKKALTLKVSYGRK
jgi:hypothetical protein